MSRAKGNIAPTANTKALVRIRITCPQTDIPPVTPNWREIAIRSYQDEITGNIKPLTLTRVNHASVEIKIS